MLGCHIISTSIPSACPHIASELRLHPWHVSSCHTHLPLTRPPHEIITPHTQPYLPRATGADTAITHVITHTYAPCIPPLISMHTTSHFCAHKAHRTQILVRYILAIPQHIYLTTPLFHRVSSGPHCSISSCTLLFAAITRPTQHLDRGHNQAQQPSAMKLLQQLAAWSNHSSTTPTSIASIRQFP